MKFNIHAGHNPEGKVGSGAYDLLSESTENRLIVAEMIRLLKLNGHTVYDCTVNNGTSQRDILEKICAKCNEHTVDLDISVHLNCGINDHKGNGKVCGFEVYCTSTNAIKGEVASRMRKRMANLGFTDRGTVIRTGLYYLNHTKNPAILIEVCFVDDRDDYELYKKLGYKKISQELVKAILNKSTITTEDKPTLPKLPVSGKKYWMIGDGRDTRFTVYDVTQIKAIQKCFNYLGIKDEDGKKLGVNGYYGPKTASCTSAFQEKYGLPVNGKFGNLCLGIMQELIK